MTVDRGVHQPAEGDKPHLVGAQIHDDSDDITVFRLEGFCLSMSPTETIRTTSWSPTNVLGTKYEARFVVSGGVVQAYYNGQLQATLAKDFSDAYFKAGAYTQANCERAAPCTSDNYGETVIYQLAVTHA